MKKKVKLLGEHHLSVIMLHGMNNNWKQFSYLYNNPEFKNIKFILINANKMDISWPNKKDFNVRSWYDYYTDYSGLNKYDKINLNHLKSINDYIHNLIDQEHQLLNDYSKIIVGGSSQGGTIAWHSVLSYPFKIGGIISLRSILLNYTPIIIDDKSNLECFIYCAGKDQIYIPKLYNRSFRRLKVKGFTINKIINKNINHFTNSKRENYFVTKILKNKMKITNNYQN